MKWLPDLLENKIEFSLPTTSLLWRHQTLMLHVLELNQLMCDLGAPKSHRDFPIITCHLVRERLCSAVRCWLGSKLQCCPLVAREDFWLKKMSKRPSRCHWPSAVEAHVGPQAPAVNLAGGVGTGSGGWVQRIGGQMHCVISWLPLWAPKPVSVRTHNNKGHVINATANQQGENAKGEAWGPLIALPILRGISSHPWSHMLRAWPTTANQTTPDIVHFNVALWCTYQSTMPISFRGLQSVPIQMAFRASKTHINFIFEHRLPFS